MRLTLPQGQRVRQGAVLAQSREAALCLEESESGRACGGGVLEVGPERWMRCVGWHRRARTFLAIEMGADSLRGFSSAQHRLWPGAHAHKQR